ncbi:GNAT family N-acetyltransferase [Georgenia sunbinii]|uniref:GNAT family N-acetyltransferase n=1 Tax=Georgenia sunbinii TaxID=3117728 RepID=UPI002F26A55B
MDEANGVAAADRRRPSPAPPVRILEGQSGSEAAARAMRAYLDELADRLESADDPELSHAADPLDVTPPRGDFILALEVATAELAGFGAVHVLAPGVVEIKRMWLRPDVRGRGLGKFLLKQLENRARALGGHRVILAVNESLVEALGLYVAAGYEPVEAFEDNPYTTHFFGKQLVSQRKDDESGR